VGVITCVGSLACVGVEEGVADPGAVGVGDSMASEVPLPVAEADGVGEAAGVSDGLGGFAVLVGTMVLGGEAGSVAVIVAGVLVVSMGGSSIEVWVAC